MATAPRRRRAMRPWPAPPCAPTHARPKRRRARPRHWVHRCARGNPQRALRSWFHPWRAHPRGSRAWRSSSCSDRVVIVDLEQDAAGVRAERPVIGARRTARVSEGLEAFAALALRVVADCEIAADEEHFLPIFM